MQSMSFEGLRERRVCVRRRDGSQVGIIARIQEVYSYEAKLIPVSTKK